MSLRSGLFSGERTALLLLSLRLVSYICLLVVLDFEPMALHLLGKCFITKINTQVSILCTYLFVSLFFETESYCVALAGLELLFGLIFFFFLDF